MCFSDRTYPDEYEKTTPEVFPSTAPGNFIWNEKMQKWSNTVNNVTNLYQKVDSAYSAVTKSESLTFAFCIPFLIQKILPYSFSAYLQTFEDDE